VALLGTRGCKRTTSKVNRVGISRAKEEAVEISVLELSVIHETRKRHQIRHHLD